MDIATMSREELERQLLWNQGGVGLGSVAGAALWNMQAPGPGKPDWPSIVAVGGDPSTYTDEELRKIVAFAQKVTERYDRMFRVRMGANLLILRKDGDGRWLRKRLTWCKGPMYSESLDEALAVLAPELFKKGEVVAGS